MLFEKAIVVKEQPKPEIVEVNNNEQTEVKEALAGTIKAEKATEIAVETSNKVKRELYYAQEIANGFQLVNSEPRVVMILLNTAAENVFIVKGKSAIVFKEDGFWYYSENDGELGEKTTMDIKF